MENDTSDFFFDPSWDLELIPDECGRERSFFVSSKAMCLASPVWRAMLDPSGFFMEAQQVKGRVRFPEDSVDTFHLLLSVVHYQFDLIPPSLEYAELFNLAVACDRYDTLDILRPWLPNWLKGLRAIANDPGKEGSLFIAWVFRDVSIFEGVARCICKSHYGRAECDAMMYGSFIKALETAELNQVLPSPCDLKRSAQELHNLLSRANFYEFPT